jgi:NADPH-dependent curcumin reductase CurA
VAQTKTVNRQLVLAERPKGEPTKNTLRLVEAKIPSLVGQQMLLRTVYLQGFIIFDDFGYLYPEFAKEIGAWVESGQIKYREEMIDGFENAPAAFIGLLRGENFGKRVIRNGRD